MATRPAAAGVTFDEVVLPNLDAAYRLARWLLGNEPDAEDAVQEASLRAWRYLQTFDGRNGRAWFLRIVRNTCYGWHDRRRQPPTLVFDEERDCQIEPAPDPESLLVQAATADWIAEAMDDLPDRFRELLVLRELEGLTYQELADVLGIPLGTVMSGLSRARQAFRRALIARADRYGSQPQLAGR